VASVEDRWFRTIQGPDGKPTKERTERHGVGLRWLVRWREPDGRARKQSFAKKVDADAHSATIEADKLRGTYIDVRAGKEPFGAYALRWLATQTTDPLSRENMAYRLGHYVKPYVLWRTELGKIKPGTVQAWLRALDGAGLAESTKLVVFAHVSAVLTAAMDDELIARNPARSSSVRKPKPDVRKVVPWSREWVMAMHNGRGVGEQAVRGLPARYRVFVPLGAGVGLRQGEAFALSPDDVDFLRGWVTVQRQVKIVGGRLVFALPKGRKVRKVPMPATVRDELAAHLAQFPAREVALPWEEPGGKPTTVRLAVTTAIGTVCHRNGFNSEVWRPSRVRAGIPAGRENGMHALRHYYASVLLDAGESIKAVSEYLGHSSAAFTLAVYTHLMPSSEERTRSAVDSAWRAPTVPPVAAEGGVTR
jgi:integrase